jgi:two-component system, NarL family, nitrate/nitrite response regulator NarL
MTRVLLADDHKFFRSGVEAALRASMIDVVGSVDSGEAALEAVKVLDPDILILDLKMPGCGGVAALQALRASGDNRPVIVLAAEVEDEALVAILDSGVNAIVSKAGAELRLLEAIQTIKQGICFIDNDLLDRALLLAKAEAKTSALDLLSPREREVAQEVARGRRNREIATAINVTEGTIKIYLHNIYRKLGIGSRTELTAMVLGLGMLGLGRDRKLNS